VNYKSGPNAAQCLGYCVLIIQSTLMTQGNTSRGCLLEVKTGEGKTCILAMVAATLALIGYSVDIVTSSTVLAQRDSDNWRPFYERLGLSVGCNTSLNSRLTSDCYSCNVVYGTASDFARDILQTEFLKHKVRSAESRSFDVVLIDEVDCMTIDQCVQCTYLSYDTVASGLRHLEPIMALIWHHMSAAYDPLYDAASNITLYRGHFMTLSDTIKSALKTLLPKSQNKSALLEELEKYDLSVFNVSVSDVSSDTLFLSEEVAKICSDVEEKLEYSFQFYIHTDQNKIKIIEHSKTPFNKAAKLNILLSFNGTTANSPNEATRVKITVATNLMSENEYITYMRDEFESNLLTIQQGAGDGKTCKWYDVFDLPMFLEQYADFNLPVWIGNAFLACQYKENREYLIKECLFKVAPDDNSDKNNYLQQGNKDESLHHFEINKFLTPVDFRNSGVTENNKVWSNGLQQFLEMKHCLPLSPLPLMTNFISNVTLLKRYKMIFGASGTLGNTYEADFVRRTYSVGFCAIPELERKLFYEVDGLILNGKVEWTEAIRERIDAEKDKGGILIICEDIQTAMELQAGDMGTYCDSEKDCTDARTIYVGVGEVLITTNLGSRGTDYCATAYVTGKDNTGEQTTVQVNRGGLFVIVTFLPHNDRVEEQAFGRTSRQGRPGSAQLILNRHDLLPDYRHCKSVFELRQLRTKNLARSIRLFETFDMKINNLREKLFAIFKATIAVDEENLLRSDSAASDINYLREQWAIWLENQTRKIIAEFNQGRGGTLDFCDKFQRLERSLQEEIKANISAILGKELKPEQNYYHSLKANSTILFKNVGAVQKNLSATSDNETRRNAVVITRRVSDVYKQIVSLPNYDIKGSAIAYYNYAYCLIQLEIEDSDVLTWFLKAAQNKLVSSISEFTKTCLFVVTSKTGQQQHANLTLFEKHANMKYQILLYLERNINENIAALNTISNSADRLKACKTLPVTQLADYISYDYFTKPILLELSQMGLSHVFIIQNNILMHKPCETFLLFTSSVIILREIVDKKTSNEIETCFDCKGVESTLEKVIDIVAANDTSSKFEWHNWDVVGALKLCLSQKTASKLKTAGQATADSALPIINQMFRCYKDTIILTRAMRVVQEYILRWTKEPIQQSKLNQIMQKLQHILGNEIESNEKLLCNFFENAISPQSEMLNTIEKLASVLAPETSDADKQIDSELEPLAVEKLAPLLDLLIEQLVKGIENWLESNAICTDETLVQQERDLHISLFGHIINQAICNAVYARQRELVIPESIAAQAEVSVTESRQQIIETPMLLNTADDALLTCKCFAEMLMIRVVVFDGEVLKAVFAPVCWVITVRVVQSIDNNKPHFDAVVESVLCKIPLHDDDSLFTAFVLCLKKPIGEDRFANFVSLLLNLSNAKEVFSNAATLHNLYLTWINRILGKKKMN
jgi:hypothetical protein